MREVWNIARAIGRDFSACVGASIVLLLCLTALFAPLLAPFPEDVWRIHLENRLQPPSLQHLFGTDRMGADIFSRMMFGARITLLVAVIAVGASLIIGVPVGLLAAYYKNWIGDVLMRTSDVFLAVPQLILAIAIAQTLGSEIQYVIVALSITYWPWFARVAYAEARSIRNEIYVEAAAALGASPLRIMAIHMLPNVTSAIVVRTTIGMGFTILTAAALGFLGLGAPPRVPEWGQTVAESRQYLPDAWWYAAAPGLLIFIVVLGFNALGDGLRDAFDPKTRR